MTFMAFNSMEEMIEYMQKRTEEANAGLAPEQQQITWGDFWVNFGALSTVGFLVFGRVYTEQEVAQGEERYVLDATRENHDRGYMFGDAFSKPYPEAETGDTHRADMWPLEPDLFAALGMVGWDHEALALTDKINLSIAHQQWRAHVREQAS